MIKLFKRMVALVHYILDNSKIIEIYFISNKRGSEIMKDQSKIEISNYSKKINKFKQKKHI